MDDPTLEAILDEMRHHPTRTRQQSDWTAANLPFADDPEARAVLRVHVARRAAIALGKLQAIDEQTARDPAVDVPF